MVVEEGNLLLTNHRLEALFGYAGGELRGTPLEKLVSEEERAELRAALAEFSVSPSAPRRCEFHGVAKSGERIPIEVELNAVDIDQGCRVIVTVTDSRRRKRHEEHFELALDAAPSAIIMVDSSGMIVLCNRLTEEVFGHTRDQLVGQSIEVLIPQRMQRDHSAYRAGYASKPRQRRMGHRSDLLGVRADGTEFPVEVALQPIQTEEDQFVITSVVDISERKASEREITAQNVRLTKLNEDLTAFAYSASHDLKAPLASIRGLSQCIAEDLDTDVDEARKNLGRIEALTERLPTLVEDVLSVANADGEGRAAAFWVDEHIQMAVARHALMSARNDVQIDVSGVSRFEVISEAVRFDSIIDNLVSNAIRYSDPDKAHRKIQISAELRGDEFDVDIRDNGLGIPEEMRERVFRMFERAHEHLPDGSGLGLALAKKHAERLSGDIRLKILDGWTIFSVRLESHSKGSP